MSRFDKVARLAYECFKNEVGYYGGIRVDKKENYIGIVTDDFENTPTEIFYHPHEKSATVMTYNQPPIAEQRFSELLNNLGIVATLEPYERPKSLLGFVEGLTPHSPSGKVDFENWELLKE